MNGPDLIPILKNKGIDRLFHANTVTTSCTFLDRGGLASRGYVEKHGLKQTPQPSDTTDRGFCIWHDVFLDTDDLHQRMSRPNLYGPVLFVFEVELLGQLPPGSEVRVTKLNPYPNKWASSDTNSDRYMLTLDEVRATLSKGTTDHIVVIRPPHSLLPFHNSPVEIVVDDPQRDVGTTGGTGDAFKRAQQLLLDAGHRSGTAISLRKRTCIGGCTCLTKYAETADLRPRFDLV
jgi:hypothetical protein